MSKIFLISGLGADTRLYNNIDIHDHDVICVDWMEPNKSDSLTTYAQKLIYQYNITPQSIVIGTSLGGLIAIEIAKKVNLKKVILISSIKASGEKPWYFSLFRSLPVYKLLPGNGIKLIGSLIKPVFGKMLAEESWLFNDMLKNSSPAFVKWAIGAVLSWKNEIIPPNTYQIVGDKDLIFPQKSKDAVIIKGGTHIMVLNKAKQINKLLKNLLKNEIT